MTPREVEKLVRKAGWKMARGRGKGSHRVYTHVEKSGVVVIPWHSNRDIAPKTLNTILKTAGLR